jgi:hypothetical protein
LSESRALIFQNDPELASALVAGGQRFKDEYGAYQRKVRQAMMQKAQYEVSKCQFAMFGILMI